jgi:PAS domain S-box-containing protein
MSPAQERLDANRRWWVLQPATVGFARYIVAVALIGAALLLRYALRSWLGPSVPYLQFFPAILIGAWYGGLGPGVVATATASLAAMYFFLPPAGFAVGAPADIVSLSLFAVTGLGIAWVNHQLRGAEGARRAEAALATERAERLDAVINTTVDGIIVINTAGTIEAFNRGAERLFGYPAPEAIGRNVNMLMPSPYHDEHDACIGRDGEMSVKNSFRRSGRRSELVPRITDARSTAISFTLTVIWRSRGSNERSCPQTQDGALVASSVTFVIVSGIQAIAQELPKGVTAAEEIWSMRTNSSVLSARAYA